MATLQRKTIRDRIHRRIRKRIHGTAERPRLSVHFSGQHIYAQVIDDSIGVTLAAVATTEAGFRDGKSGANQATAEKVGQLIAERSKAKQIENVVFDRGGHLYHGKVRILADAARTAGLNF